ncbi:MAG TPA: sulfite exporter TauE/SafE family protein, partial [Thermomicrobiales bacterium]|nr:sulfite exporter TauE/SafE family protein [Thermomicrobiales bacterium]
MDATLLVAMLIVAVSGVIFGMTGFGFAMISVPPLLLLYGPETVVALTIGASMLTSVIVVLGNRQELDRRLVLTMLPGAFVGLLLGAWILEIVDPTVLKIGAGAFVTAYSVLLLRGYQPTGMGSTRAATIAGTFSGALGTSTGLSGPPVVILFTARQLAVN